MKTLLLTALLTFASSLDACYAFLDDSYISGLTRICVYDHLGDTVITSVRSVQLCPQTTYVVH